MQCELKVSCLRICGTLRIGNDDKIYNIKEIGGCIFSG